MRTHTRTHPHCHQLQDDSHKHTEVYLSCRHAASHQGHVYDCYPVCVRLQQYHLNGLKLALGVVLLQRSSGSEQLRANLCAGCDQMCVSVCVFECVRVCIYGVGGGKV